LPRSRGAAAETAAIRGFGLGTVSPALILLFVAYFLEGVGYIVSGTFLVAIVDGMPGLAGLGSGVWIVVGLAVIPSSALWAASAARIGYARALVAAYALQVCGIALPLAGGAGAAFVSALLFGGTFAGITALTLTLAGFLTPRRSASLIGALTASFGIGQVIGPVLAGIIASRAHGFAPALIVASGIIFVAAALMAALHLFDVAPRTGRLPPIAVDTGPRLEHLGERE
jgi:MFS family permease